MQGVEEKWRGDKERCLCRAGMRDLPWQRKVNVHDTAEGKRVC